MPKPSILALHGFTGSGEDFKEFSPFCHTLGLWHCPDLPGHGTANDLDCTPEATVCFVQQQRIAMEAGPLLSCTTDEQPPHDPADTTDNKGPSSTPPSHILLGYSMGARAALQHACAHPESWDALILISPNPGIESADGRTERRRVDDKLAQRIETDGAAAFIEFWQSTPMIRSQQRIRSEWRAAMRASRAQHTATGLARSLREFGQGSCPNLWPELSKLKIPVLLITGAEDIKYTRIAEQMASSFTPYTSHFTIPNAGHMPHLEQPGATAAAIDGFISSLNFK